MRSLCSSAIPYPTGLRTAGAKSETIIGVSGANRPTCFERFRETPCADPHAGCCGGWGLETPGYPISFYTTGRLASNAHTPAVESRAPLAKLNLRCALLETSSRRADDAKTV